MPRTGFVGADAQDDFLRARRRRAASLIMPPAARRAGRRQRHPPVRGGVAALGRTGEHRLGLQVDPARLDRRHRRPHARVRPPASAPPPAACAGAGSGSPPRMRRGESLPPIDVYRIGELHFVRDGHHRVSVARALGRTDIDAYVTEVETRVGAERGLRPSDLPLQGPRAAVPRARAARRPPRASAIRLSDPWRLRLAGRGRRGLGLARRCRSAHALHGPRAGRARVVRRRVPAGGRAPARRRPARPGDRGRRLPCASAQSATGCCAPTSGATRRSRRSAPSAAQALTVAGVEQVDLGGVEPELGLLALGRLAGRARAGRRPGPSSPALGISAVPASSASSAQLRRTEPLRASTVK